MKTRFGVHLVAVLAMHGSASCLAALSAHWVEVDNRVLPGTLSPSGLDNGTLNGTRYRTFDLFIKVSNPILVVDSGVTQTSGLNQGLSLGSGSFFQTTKGGLHNDFSPSASEISTEPLLGFDTFWAFGQRSRSAVLVTQPLQFGSDSAKGTWSVLPGQSESGDAFGRVFVGRFTVPTTTGFGSDESAQRRLSGKLFVFSKGASSGELIEVPNAYVIPGAGVMPLLAILGAVAFRARRR